METEAKQPTPLSSEQMEQWENDGFLLIEKRCPIARNQWCT